MTCFRPVWFCAIGILLCFGASGCLPSGENRLDEQKEPHFLTGRNLVSQMDFPGAINSFERALEVNPRSASAHFELGCLYEEKVNDPAAAIYHYEQFLKLRPNANESELARGHIAACKMELARTVTSLGSLPPSTQHEMERILLENKELKAKLAAYEAASAVRPPASSNPPVQNPARPAPEPAQTGTVRTASAQLNPVVASRPPGPATARTHTIKSGEIPSVIARKYGISVSALMAANPQVKPTRLQVGQVLNIPAP
ncbi:MAG TPA: LysM peptidoglycan-binding domain-containing protein [Verrucomicrobiae bacterium]|nr:LysM peptidoglycan-binding domain-containing protein [Verrucomicrobiae bacterium]